jgi:hypothetical protein
MTSSVSLSTAAETASELAISCDDPVLELLIQVARQADALAAETKILTSDRAVWLRAESEVLENLSAGGLRTALSSVPGGCSNAADGA